MSGWTEVSSFLAYAGNILLFPFLCQFGKRWRWWEEQWHRSTLWKSSVICQVFLRLWSDPVDSKSHDGVPAGVGWGLVESLTQNQWTEGDAVSPFLCRAGGEMPRCSLGSYVIHTMVEWLYSKGADNGINDYIERHFQWKKTWGF